MVWLLNLHDITRPVVYVCGSSVVGFELFSSISLFLLCCQSLYITIALVNLHFSLSRFFFVKTDSYKMRPKITVTSQGRHKSISRRLLEKMQRLQNYARRLFLKFHFIVLKICTGNFLGSNFVDDNRKISDG